MSVPERAESAAPCCPAHDIDAMLAGLPAPVRLWAQPIREPLAMVAGTAQQPVGQLTMQQLVAWAALLLYSAATGMIIGHLAGNLTLAALRGPYRR